MNSCGPVLPNCGYSRMISVFLWAAWKGSCAIGQALGIDCSVALTIGPVNSEF